MSQYDFALCNSDDILDKLYTLDYLCKKEDIYAELIIFGGAGILLLLEKLGTTFRSTRDIDVNLLSTNNKDALVVILHEVGIDIVSGVIEVPPVEDFNTNGSKYELEVDFSAIRVFVPTFELLAISKIFSTREKDLVDLKEFPILENCDLNKLTDMITEYKNYVLNPDNPDLNLHQLVDILPPMDI